MFHYQFNNLGRYICSDGYQIDQANIKAVTDLVNQKPRTVGEVRQLLGLISYYRKYIDSFPKITQPLYDLLKKLVSTSSQVPTSSTTVVANKDPLQLKSPTPMTWQKYLVIMIFIFLHVNAFTKLFGCSLYQQTQGKLHILRFGSRTLSKVEKRCHT